MLKSNLATYPNTQSGASYGRNLAEAARAFVAALLAIQPAKPQSVEAESVDAQFQAPSRARAISLRKLYQLAASHDTVNPSLAAELRSIAARG
jgi:hypothetical protein